MQLKIEKHMMVHGASMDALQKLTLCERPVALPLFLSPSVEDARALAPELKEFI